MQLNVRFLRKILNTIKDKESHFVSVADILEDVKADSDITDNEVFKDLFYGHMLLLYDNGVIEQLLGHPKLGITYNVNKQITSSGCLIRLTSQGYDYIKILNKNGIIDKIKNFTLSEGLKLGELLLVECVKENAKNLILNNIKM